MHRLYANTMPFYIKDLNIHGFWYLPGGPGANPPGILKDNCTKKMIGTCEALIYTRKDSGTKKFEPNGWAAQVGFTWLTSFGR